MSNSSSLNGINSTNDSTTNKLYEETKRKLDDLNQKVERLERDIRDRDQIIEKLVRSFFQFLFRFLIQFCLIFIENFTIY